MSTVRIFALVLIVGGILGLVYGKFSFTKDRHDVKLGPVEFAVKEKETVKIPTWAGAAAIGVGALLLLAKK